MGYWAGVARVRVMRVIAALAMALVGSLAALAAVSEQPAGAVAVSGVTTMLRVAFASPSDGVGLFELIRHPVTGTAGETCEIFTRASVDGGARFGSSGKSIVRSNCATTAVSQLATDGAGDVFAYGPDLFVSHDDGASWRSSSGLRGVVALVAVGRSVWALDESCPQPATNPSAACELTLLVSTNGGRSWARAPRQPPLRSFERSAVGDPELSTWLVRPSLGSADIVLPPAARGAAATIDQTTNAGAAWRTVRAPCAAGGLTTEFATAPNGALWLVCAGEPGVGNQEKSVVRSLDGGKTWSTSGPVCELGSTTCKPAMPFGGYLGGLAALSSSTVFYVGGRSSLTVTRNAGRSWTALPGFSGDASGTADVTFFNVRDGWAIDESFGGHAVLWRTSDGGLHWARLTTAT